LAIRASEVSPGGRCPLLDEVGEMVGMVRTQTNSQI
jgi:hypothetical protein